MEKNTQCVLAQSSALAVPAWRRDLAEPAASGIDVRSRLGSVGTVATVRTTPTHVEFMREKSVQIADRRIRTLLNSQQLSSYGFGTPVGVDTNGVEVLTGVPPRSRPV